MYCRPSCASRLALRENVAFHATTRSGRTRRLPALQTLQARSGRAGGAACGRRSRGLPHHRGGRNSAVARRTRRGRGMSRFHFHRIFKAITGVTPKAYASARRAERVRSELAASRTVTQAIYDAGFNSSGRFYAQSAEILGMTPRRFPRRRLPRRRSASRWASVRSARSWSRRRRRASARSSWATIPKSWCAICRIASRAPSSPAGIASSSDGRARC